jgi:hypothetical protein
VVTWRQRCAEFGLPGLEDPPRPGEPSPLPEALCDRVRELTLTEPPTQFGATRRSSRGAGRGTGSGSAAASSPGDVKVRDDVRERLIGW